MTGFVLPRRRKIRLAAAAVLCLLAVALLPAMAAAEVEALPLSEVREGMEGYGLTVFAGSRIDTFGVRVLGVQETVRVDGSLILVEVFGHDLALSAVPQGMSGSPIYLDGRFAGAVAFGWPGALRAVAGVTPAAEMLRLPTSVADDDEAAAASVSEFRPAMLPTSTVGRRLAVEIFGETNPDAPVGIAAVPVGEGWPSAEDVARRLFAGAFGFTSETPVSLLHRPLGAAGSGAVDGGGTTLQAGSACAVPFILGDAQLGAVGTTTVVDGDRVLMMGHPLMQRGPVLLPLATAEIVTVFPSRDMSFKMGSIGQVVGAVHHDNRAGLAGRLGATAPLLPVTVSVEAAGRRRDYAYQVVADAQLTPGLVFWTVYNSVLAEADDAGRQSVHWLIEADWHLEGGPREILRLEGSAPASLGVGALAPEWMAPLQILLNNRYGRIDLDAVRGSLELRRPTAEAVIAAAGAPLVAEAGQRIEVDVALEARRGGSEDMKATLTLPAGLAPGRYRIVVASERDLFALETERAAGRFADRSLAATIELLAMPRSASRLAIEVFCASEGVLVDGRELPALPGSVRTTLRADPSGRVAPTLADSVTGVRIETQKALSGYVIRNLEIVSKVDPVREGSRP